MHPSVEGCVWGMQQKIWQAFLCLSKPNLKFTTKWSKHSGVTRVPKAESHIADVFFTLITD